MKLTACDEILHELPRRGRPPRGETVPHHLLPADSSEAERRASDLLARGRAQLLYVYRPLLKSCWHRAASGSREHGGPLLGGATHDLGDIGVAELGQAVKVVGDDHDPAALR